MFFFFLSIDKPPGHLSSVYSFIREIQMADKYQKDSKAASFKKHKQILAWNAKISMFFIVAELNNVILAFTDVKMSMKG